MSEELQVVEEKHELSGSPFTSAEKFQELFDIGKMFASSNLVPANYQNRPVDCALAVDMANRNGLNPIMVMQNLYVVKGKPSWSGQSCTAMIKASKEFKNVRHIYTGEENTDTWGCYLQATSTVDGTTVKGPKVTIAMAKAEGWYSKKDKYGNETSKWQSMPELMLAYRASAFFARVNIPNALMGYSVEGEVTDIEKTVEQAPDIFAESEVMDNGTN